VSSRITPKHFSAGVDRHLESSDVKPSLSLISLALAASVAAPTLVLAQADWSSGQPKFDSQIRAQADQLDAERAARRQNYAPVVYPKFMEGGERPDIKPAVPPIVTFDRQEDVGSIIVDTAARKLYFVLANKQAYEYPISVGRDGFTWQGTERISRIAPWPSWTPPPEMHKRVPGLPITVTGGLKNPQGARALYLGNTIYRIHGTNNDRTVGRANSSGCFRLTNEHVVHLASIARVGTKVKVLQSYNGAVSAVPPMPSLFDLFGADPEPAPKPAVGVKPKPRPVAKKAAPAATPVAAVAPSAAPAPASPLSPPAKAADAE
jgi:lipoprotein-anchoring transpeptidase ErfK/SrfK